MAVKQQSIKEYTTHIYALDLKKIYQAYESRKKSIAQEQRFEVLKNFIKFYCGYNNIHFEKTLSIIVLPNQKLSERNETYLKFIELYLEVIDLKIISNFLDYQLRLFRNKNGRIKFVASINNFVIPFINIDYNADGNLRINEIKKWHEKNELKYKVEIKVPVIKRFVAEKVDWPLINKISEGLFERNVTINKTDFNLMINQAESIRINKNKVLIFSFVIKHLHEKYRKISVKGLKKGAYLSVLNKLLKSSNGNSYDSKYIHNYILEKKIKNSQSVIAAEQEADEIILHFGKRFIKLKHKKPDR